MAIVWRQDVGSLHFAAGFRVLSVCPFNCIAALLNLSWIPWFERISLCVEGRIVCWGYGKGQANTDARDSPKPPPPRS